MSPRLIFLSRCRRLFAASLGLLLSPLLAARGQSVAYDPPAGYYATATGKTGPALETSLHGIIANHTVLSYTPGVWDALSVLDADPANPSNSVIQVYSGLSNLISNQYHSGSTTGKWSREHLWCQSFFNYDAKIKTDVFNLRPVDGGVNSTRNDRYYDTSVAPYSTTPNAPGSSYNVSTWEPRDADKGAIARVMFYMAVCYDGTAGGVSTTKLTVSDSPDASTNTFGKLSTFLAWNRQYPVTEAERKRNQFIFNSYQRNRNPFVDNRYLADQIFGGANTTQQAWLKTRFSAAELAVPAISGDLASPAGDDISNLAKYAFNLDPKTSGVSRMPVGGMMQSGSTTYLTLTHRQNRQASDLTFIYQSSADLKNWTNVSPAMLGSAHADADATDLVTIGVPATGASQFLRVVISKP